MMMKRRRSAGPTSPLPYAYAGEASQASPSLSRQAGGPAAPSAEGLPGTCWEAQAVSDFREWRARLRWKRPSVLVWIGAFLCVALLALYSSTHPPWGTAGRDLSGLLRSTYADIAWFTGALVVVGIALAMSVDFARRYFRPIPAPANLTARQRALLGLSAESGGESVSPRPKRISIEETRSSGAPLSHFRPSAYASPPPVSPARERDHLHRIAVTRRLLQSSPASSVREPVITDQQTLERYLQRSPADGTAGGYGYLSQLSPIGTGTESPPPVSLYRVSPRSSPAGKGRTGDEFGYFNTQAAQELVDRLGIEGLMEEWTERTRQWLLEHVIWPLVRDIKEVTKAGLPLTKPLTQAQTSATAATTDGTASSSLWYGFRAAPQPTTNSFSQNPVVLKRQTLEKYMDVHGSPSREYIVQRIQELAAGGCMAAFKWNGGGSWQGKPWTTELPTDSQILIHLFCAYMDSLLPVDPRADKNKPFSSLYYVLAPKSPDMVPTAAKIYQSHVHPPHFKVLLPNEVWDTFQGRNNLFHAIFLWVYAVHTRLDGYIGQVHLSDTGLDQIINADS